MASATTTVNTHATDGAQTDNRLIAVESEDVTLVAFVPGGAEADAVREAFDELGAELSLQFPGDQAAWGDRVPEVDA